MTILIIFSICFNIVLNNIILTDYNFVLSSFFYIPLIVIIYPYLKTKEYIIWVIIISLFASSDIRMLFINVSLFLTLSFLIKRVFTVVKYNLLSLIIINNFIMLIYSFIMSSILLLLYNIDIYYIIKPFYNTFLMNNLFIVLFYLSSKKIKSHISING